MTSRLLSSSSLEVDLKGKNPEILLINNLKTDGCAVLKNHEVPIHLVSETLKSWGDFFSNDNKINFLRTDDTDEGFIPLSVETAVKGQIADYKELYQTHHKGQYPNNVDTDSTIKLFDSLVKVSEKIICLLDTGLPYSIKQNMTMSLPQMIDGSNNHLLRIIHYPPIELGIEIPRAAAHTDICLFTVVFGSTFRGLELQNPTTGKWYEPDVEDTSIVVFNSEMLEICTQGYLKAVVHCVKANPNSHIESRYSIPMGFHPRRQSLLSKDLTAVDHLRKRLNEMGYDGNLLNLNDC
jgi:isopenicillin N synthase-like dioxygenase